MIISVNLSAKQFQHPKLAEEIEQVVRETKIDPYTFVLETTESMVMKNAERSASMLQRIKGLDPQIMIDDFGTITRPSLPSSASRLTC